MRAADETEGEQVSNDCRVGLGPPPERTHVLWCDEMHAHSAPNCCGKDCWCRRDAALENSIETWSDEDIVGEFRELRVCNHDDDRPGPCRDPMLDGIGADWIDQHFDALVRLLERGLSYETVMLAAESAKTSLRQQLAAAEQKVAEARGRYDRLREITRQAPRYMAHLSADGGKTATEDCWAPSGQPCNCGLVELLAAIYFAAEAREASE